MLAADPDDPKTGAQQHKAVRALARGPLPSTVGVIGCSHSSPQLRVLALVARRIVVAGGGAPPPASSGRRDARVPTACLLASVLGPAVLVLLPPARRADWPPQRRHVRVSAAAAAAAGARDRHNSSSGSGGSGRHDDTDSDDTDDADDEEGCVPGDGGGEAAEVLAEPHGRVHWASLLPALGRLREFAPAALPLAPELGRPGTRVLGVAPLCCLKSLPRSTVIALLLRCATAARRCRAHVHVALKVRAAALCAAARVKCARNDTPSHHTHPPHSAASSGPVCSVSWWLGSPQPEATRPATYWTPRPTHAARSVCCMPPAPCTLWVPASERTRFERSAMLTRLPTAPSPQVLAWMRRVVAPPACWP